ncbi:leukotriene B4 receptor 1-like [Polymixia lowei]
MENLNLTVFSSNASNISSSLGRPLPMSWEVTRLLPGVVMSLCVLLGVPGNLLVIAFLRKNNQQLSSLCHGLMLNLAISDLLCLLHLPFWIYMLFYHWTLGLAACKMVSYLAHCGVIGGLLSVTLLSVTRYVQVVHLRTRAELGQGAKRALLVLPWVAVGILTIPVLVVQELTNIPRTDLSGPRILCRPTYSSHSQEAAALLIKSLLGFVVPFFIMTSAYICLHRRVNQTAFFNNPRTTRLVTSVIAAFFLLWMPYHLVNILGATAIFRKDKYLLEMYNSSGNVVASLTFVNSCLDPLLYVFASRI